MDESMALNPRPEKGKDPKAPPTLSDFNQLSRVHRDEEEERITFYFNYGKDSDYSDTDDTNTWNWRTLKKLKEANKWGVIRHPMVLNYVNERLIDCASFYTLHILVFASYLILLSSHIFWRSTIKDWLVTAFLALFLITMCMKVVVKMQVKENKISFWFVVACVFNVLTYLATFAYVWLPVLFTYDNYHQDVKALILWFLPIIAIISAWLNFLYILRKSPYGMYIFMMVRILRSFGHIATIWIPTLIAFSFAFHLIMRDSGIEPWESVNKDANSTAIHKMFVILQAVTKTSTMMIGEVDANDILGTRQWIPSILVLAFEIITVILLMNLMVSLAVGDVSDLRNTAQDKLLRIKVNFVIEALQLSEFFSGLLVLFVRRETALFGLHKKKTNNVLKVEKEGYYRTTRKEGIPFNQENVVRQNMEGTISSDQAFSVKFVEPGMKMRVESLQGRSQTILFRNCTMTMVETSDSGIKNIEKQDVEEEEDGCWRRYCKWLIGIDWEGYVDV